MLDEANQFASNIGATESLQASFFCPHELFNMLKAKIYLLGISFQAFSMLLLATSESLLRHCYLLEPEDQRDQ